jgi:cytochrome P450
MTSVERKYDLYSHDAKVNAYEIYAAMRGQDPVHCQPGIDGETMIWFVSRYADVEMMLRDERHFVRDQHNAVPPEERYQNSPLEDLVTNHMLNKDGPDHRRLRNLVSKAFTPKRVAALRPHIEEIADSLLDPVLARGEMDLMADFAFHLPTIVISEMLGIPPEDRESFQVWSDAVLRPALDEASMAEFVRLMGEFTTYLRELFETRRLAPQDDLVTALLEAEEAGERLSEQELFSTMVLLIVAGHETTVSAIGNAMLALWAHPEQLALLQANPDLMPNAVEEFLRYDSAVERALNRWVGEEVTLGDQTLRRGEIVIGILGSANRDEDKFEGADTLDITRQPNPHLAFGKGPHYCLGAPLARLEIEIALSSLLRRLPDIRLAAPQQELRWRLNPGFRRLEALPVVWDRSQTS